MLSSAIGSKYPSRQLSCTEERYDEIVSARRAVIPQRQCSSCLENRGSYEGRISSSSRAAEICTA